MAETSQLLRMGQLAQEAKTGKATIEHYLKLGLLEPEHVEVQGYRLFHSESITRIRLIKQARLAGFGLPEVRAMFRAIPLNELDELLSSLAPIRCRQELRARGVDISLGMPS